MPSTAHHFQHTNHIGNPPTRGHYISAVLDVPVERAFTLLRNYARTNREHLTDVARRLMTDRHSRAMLLADISALAASPH